MDKEKTVFVAANTEEACWRPSKNKRIVVTDLKIENNEEQPVCIRVDIGERTRFVAYLDRAKRRINEVHIKLPVPLSGNKDEAVSILTFERLPVSVSLAGYEV